MIPAPGDRGYDAYYTKFPLGVGTSPPFGPIPNADPCTVGPRGWWLMLSRFVRIQLAIFTIASVIGVLVMVFTYMQAPTLLGIGRITVKLELPASGGLYRFSNVTYRGVQVGKVTAMDVSRTQATATTVAGHVTQDSGRPGRPRCAASPRSASSTSNCCRARIRRRTYRTAR